MFTIQDVTVQGALYRDAIIWWWLDKEFSFVTLTAPALTGFGIATFPTSADTGGFSVTDVDVLGANGHFAQVGVAAATGASTDVAERIPILTPDVTRSRAYFPPIELVSLD